MPSTQRWPRSMDKDAAAQAYTPAAHHALRSFPIQPGEITLVSLSENVTFRVIDMQDGNAYVLRLHRPGYHTLDELNSERMWTRALGGAGIAVPTPVAACDGRDFVRVFIPSTSEHRYAGMTRWTEGELLADVLSRTNDGGVIEGYFARLGSIVAAMHNQASAWPQPASFTRHALDSDGLMGDAPFWGPFWTHPALSQDERTLLLDTRGRIRGALARYGRHPSSYGLIHADLHPGNVLVAGDELLVIDFDDAGFGWHLYDVAVALARYRAAPAFAAIQRAFVEGYRARRDLPAEALALLPMFLLIRSLAVIGWIHQRPELERSRSVRDLIDAVCAQCMVFEPPC
jgi:Ser/Thr protein kinase RdoA (MazF antagonist)